MATWASLTLVFSCSSVSAREVGECRDRCDRRKELTNGYFHIGVVVKVSDGRCVDDVCTPAVIRGNVVRAESRVQQQLHKTGGLTSDRGGKGHC